MEYHHRRSDVSEDDGRCRRHPSPPLHGVCPACLRERISLLCPECASPRPSCSCHPSSASASTSTSTSGAAGPSAASSSSDHAAVGTVAPMSYFISAEPSLRRSRSAAIPSLRSRPSDANRAAPAPAPAPPDEKRPRLSILLISKLLHFRVFRRVKSRRAGDGAAARVEAKGNAERLYRSRSVGASCRPPEPPSAGPAGSGGGKGRGWHFPSPIKAFRQSKADKILQQRSPLCRG